MTVTLDPTATIASNCFLARTTWLEFLPFVTASHECFRLVSDYTAVIVVALVFVNPKMCVSLGSPEPEFELIRSRIGSQLSFIEIIMIAVIISWGSSLELKNLAVVLRYCCIISRLGEGFQIIVE